jgi:hypothetical protein
VKLPSTRPTDDARGGDAMSISAHCGSCDRKLLLGQLTQPSDGFRCPFCGVAFAPAYAGVTPRLSSRIMAAQAALATALTELQSMTGSRLRLDPATVLDPIADALPQLDEPDPTRGRRTHWWARRDTAQSAQRSSTAEAS